MGRTHAGKIARSARDPDRTPARARPLRRFCAVRPRWWARAFHVPRGWRLGYLTRRWIKAAGGQYRKSVSRIRPIGGSVNCAWTSPALYRENLERLANYLTKGSDSKVAAELGLDLLKPGGAIVGKRWGRTQNLGASPG